MRKNATLIRHAIAILLTLPLWLATPGFAQNSGAERVFHSSKTAVENAVQSLHSTLNGRLPVFDGFVEKAGELSDQYSRGYYELTVKATAEGEQGTRVRVTAKITAWYTDASAAHSGYRVLASNGRLEADLLDRIEEALAPKGQAPNSSRGSQTAAPTPSSSTNSTETPAARVSAGAGGLQPPDRSALVRNGLATVAPAAVSQPEGIAAVATSAEDIESLKHRREEAEKHLNQRKIDVQNLQEILANQSHPTDIAVVRKSGTRVLTKPSAGASVLFSADADDEFQVLDSTADWIHVQISGASRGWIHRADLDLPPGLGATAKQGGASAGLTEAPFRVAREETSAFQGNWEALKGKMVKIFWAEPTSGGTKTSSAGAKRDFAKSLLIKAYQEISSHDQALAGVVIVFDSADGGEIAATLDDLKKWQAGALSEASFWQLCSVDPPELFQLSDFARTYQGTAS